jgi:hypothetical protein
MVAVVLRTFAARIEIRRECTERGLLVFKTAGDGM